MRRLLNVRLIFWLVRSQRGTTIVEYALLLSLIALAMTAFGTAFSDTITDLVYEMAGSMGGNTSDVH